MGFIAELWSAHNQASAAKKAAGVQSTAANNAADMVGKQAQGAVDYTKGVYGTTQANAQPYQQAGAQAIGQLSAGTAAGGQFASTPTADQVMSLDPGFDFRLQQGQTALQRAEAAGGSLGSGGALKAATRYGQDYASGEFGNAWNRYMGSRQQNFQNLSSIAGMGQQANQVVAGAGTSAASNVANTTMNGAHDQADLRTQAANATASGYVGAANAWSSAVNNINNQAMSLAQMFGG